MHLMVVLCDTLNALFEVHPLIALDAFLLPTVATDRSGMFDTSSRRESPFENLALSTLEEWANVDPNLRYPALGRFIRMFVTENGDEKNLISPRFVSLLNKAPDKPLFMGGFWNQVHPRSWCGSLAGILSQRKAALLKFSESDDGQMRAWLDQITPELDSWIDRERGRDRATEESFE